MLKILIFVLILNCFYINAQASGTICENLFNLNNSTSFIEDVDHYEIWPVELTPSQVKLNLSGYSVFGVNYSTQKSKKQSATIVSLNEPYDNRNYRSIYFGDTSLQMRSKVRNALQIVFDTYIKRNIIPESSVSALIQIEGNLPSNRSIYFISVNPINQKALEVIRVFDASPDNTTVFSSGYSKDKKTEKLPIEIEYPNLVLEERKKSEKPYLIEIGRLVKTDEVLETNVEHIFGKVAQFLNNNHNIDNSIQEPVIYIEATAVGRKLYRRYGFVDVFTPVEIGVENRYIMKIKSSEFIDRFYFKSKKAKFIQSDVDAIRLKEKLEKFMQNIFISWNPKSLPNSTPVFNNKSFADVNLSLFKESMYLEAQIEFRDYINKIGGVKSNTFWRDYMLSFQKTVASDPEYLSLMRRLKEETKFDRTVVQLGLSDISLAVQIVQSRSNLKLAIEDYTEDFKLLMTNYFSALRGQLTKLKDFLSAETSVDTFILNHAFYRAGSRASINSKLSKIFSNLRPGGKLIIKEPTPYEFKRNSFSWFSINPHTLIANKSATYRDLYFQIFAIDELHQAEGALNFYRSDELKAIVKEAGFELVTVERVLYNSEILLVFRKPNEINK